VKEIQSIKDSEQFTDGMPSFKGKGKKVRLPCAQLIKYHDTNTYWDVKV
jgi:hypothetical protein